MFQLRLNVRRCISCGICMDVCRPGAIAMSIHRLATVEGTHTHRALASAANVEPEAAGMMTFPCMAEAQRCDGCEACVRECPAEALSLSA